MSAPVKKRTYTSPVRQEQAAHTRARIVDAASHLFLTDGYVRTSIRAIAERAGVAADTVYTVFGSKPRVLTAVVDARLAPSGESNVTDRPDARAVRDETDQRRQLERFGQDMAATSARVRPIYEVMRSAAEVEPAVAEVFAEMNDHRLANMRRLAEWIAARGQLAVDVERAGDIIWAIASPDVAHMLVDIRGWTDEEYATWIAETLSAQLLPPRPGRKRS